MKTLTTPQDFPKVTKIACTKVRTFEDDDPVRAEVQIELYAQGGDFAAGFTLTAHDVLNSTSLVVNAPGKTVSARFYTAAKDCPNAATAIITAMATAGTRNAKKDAVLDACLACGLVDSALACA